VKMRTNKVERRKFSNLKLGELEKNVRAVLSNVSKNYRQKLVYKLLNTIKTGDRNEFYWNVARVLNANSDNPEASKVSENLSKFLEASSSRDFEKVAYAVVFGIISAGGE